MRVVIVGCGYLGLRAAREWQQRGHTVTALTRSPDRAREWTDSGLKTVVGDVLNPESLRALPAADVCLYAVGYDRHAQAAKRAVYVDGLKTVLAALHGKIGRWIYVSSTSVYGQDQGEVVTEDSVCEPQSEGGEICLAAERLFEQALAMTEVTRCIVRLAGLYGPSRLIARRDQLHAGTPLSGNPDSWLNLIHVDDAVQAVLRLSELETIPQRLLLTDGHPLSRREFYSALASAVGAPAPGFASEGTDGLNKRCDGSRSWKALGLVPKFPKAVETLPELLGT